MAVGIITSEMVKEKIRINAIAEFVFLVFLKNFLLLLIFLETERVNALNITFSRGLFMFFQKLKIMFVALV